MVNDIEVYQGDDHDITVTFTDSDDVAIDVSNYVIFFTVKENLDDIDDNASIKKDQTIGAGAGTSGIVTISLVPSNTSSLAAGNYHYDIQWKDDSNKIKTVIKGDFILKEEVTTRTTAV